MTPPDGSIREVVGQWIDKAREDITTCEILLDSNAMVTGITAFHAQQAAEKYLKALLVFREETVPKTHSIRLLLELLAPSDKELAESLKTARELTPYGVLPRYPGDLPEISIGDARRLYQLALSVRDAVLDLLPPLR